MSETNTKVVPDDQPIGPETPEDVAILYSWANLPGAKYRDFSASRREYRAQQRAIIAEEQREAALTTAREMEESADREISEAERQLEEAQQSELEAAADAEAKIHAEDVLRRAQERAEQERQEAQRQEQSAEELRQRAEAAREEMMEARKRAEEQAARYAEFDAQYRAQIEPTPAATLPGELADPYYYTGQVDPAYFASTPGVRTAQAMRTSKERRAYVYPVHPGSDDFDSGALQAHRPNMSSASPTEQDYRPATLSYEDRERQAASEQQRRHGRPSPTDYDAANDDYYDGGPSTQPSDPRHNRRTTDLNPATDRDIHIRPSVQRAVKHESSNAESAMQVFAPTPRSRPSQVGANLVDQRRRNDPAPVLGRPPFLPEPAASVAEPVSPVDGSYWRSADRRFQGGRRRSDMPSDSRARTVRHPRSNEAQAPSLKPEEKSWDSTVPPAWLTSAERSAQQPAISRYTEDADYADDLSGRQDQGATRQGAYSQTFEGWQALDDGFDTTPSAQETEAHAERRPLPPLDHTKLRGAQGARPQGKDYSLLNGFDPNRRIVTSDLRQSASVQAPDAGFSHPQGKSQFSPKEAIQAATPEYAEPALGTPTPDTLQQSRERVASRWFALRGLVGSQDGEDTEAARVAELCTPALTVLSLSGGVGKTSIVATLGRTLSSLGEKVMLADTNTHGLLPYYFGARDLRPGSARTFTPPPGSTDAPVLLVNYEVDGLRADEPAQDRMLEDVYRRAKLTQRVLVDLSAGGMWMARRLASHHPLVLVPVSPDMNSVLGTQTVERLFSEVIDAEGRPVKPFYVLNQFDRSLPLHLDVREVLRQFLGERLLPTMIQRAPAVSEALAEGMTVVDYAPGSSVAEDYMNLANWVRHHAAPGYSGSRGARWSER